MLPLYRNHLVYGKRTPYECNVVDGNNVFIALPCPSKHISKYCAEANMFSGRNTLVWMHILDGIAGAYTQKHIHADGQKGVVDERTRAHSALLGRLFEEYF